MTNPWWGANCQVVRPGNPGVSPFYISQNPIPDSVHGAIAAKQRTQGWSEQVIARSTFQRKKRRFIWFGREGMTVGNMPDATFFDHKDALNFLQVTDKDEYRAYGRKWGHDHPNYTAYNGVVRPNYILNGYGRGTPSLDQYKAVAEFFVRRTLPEGIPIAMGRSSSTPYYQGATLSTAFMNKWNAEVAPKLHTHTAVCWQTFDAGRHVNVHVYLCPKPAGWQGIDMLLFGWNENGSETPGVHALSGMIASRVWAWLAKNYDHWNRNLLNRMNNEGTGQAWDQVDAHLGPITPTDVVPWLHAGSTPSYQHPTLGRRDRIQDHWNMLCNVAYNLMIQFKDNTEFGASPNGFTAYWPIEANEHLFLTQGYVVGAPTWLETSSFLGEIQYNGNEIIIPNAKVSLQWRGSLLKQLGLDSSTEITAEEKARVEKLTIRSFLQPTSRSVPHQPLLAKTKVGLAAAKEGVSMASRVLFPAERDMAAITYGQAESAAKGQNTTLVHQVVGSPVPTGRFHIIKFDAYDVGAPTEVITNRGYDNLGNEIEALEADDWIDSIFAGCIVENNTPYDQSTLLMKKWGYELLHPDDRDEEQQLKYGREFDETKIFGSAGPDVDLLTEGERAGFYLMQFGRSRSHLSSVVVAALQQGRLDYRSVK